MSMLTLYLIALGIGGAMVIITLVLGGDGDADADADFHAGGGGDLHADAGGDVHLEASGDGAGDVHGDADGDGGSLDFLSAWLPLSSLRFWTFFAAAFGLAGTLLTALELGPSPVIAVGSIAVGYLCGWGVVASMRKMGSQVVSSSLGSEDYVGAAGKVVLPIAAGRTGKIRLHLAGRVIEVLAETEEEEEIAAGEPVMVYEVKDDGRAVVARGEKDSE